MRKKYPIIPYSLYLLVFIFYSNVLFSQNTQSIPLVKNFTKATYGGGTQTWDITEGKNGLMFFANNDGLLLFDGNKFSKYPLPNKTILRSVFYDSVENRIYAGGQNEFGYYQFAENGSLSYQSLTKLLPNNLVGFEDVWNVCKQQNRVYFQTRANIFVLDNNTILLLKLPCLVVENLFCSNNQLLFTCNKGGIYSINNKLVSTVIANTNLEISGVIALNNTEYIVTTIKDGLFKLSNNNLVAFGNNNAVLKTDRIYKAIQFKNQIALATNRNGVFFIDMNGDLVKHIHVKSGLQNNNVLSLYNDKLGNIWLGLDNGIDLLMMNYPFGNVMPDGLLKGTGYVMAEHGGQYYFGTNNGLYSRPIKHQYANDFSFVNNTEGQVWWVQTINNKLFVCHHEGLFEVNNLNATKILDVKGCWKIVPLVKNPGYFIVGTYNGLHLLKWQNNTLIEVLKFNTFKESSRFLAQDDEGNIWVGHPYKGVYKIKLSPDLQSINQIKIYGTQHGLPTKEENYVFSTNAGLLFCTQKGVYNYKSDKDRFELNTVLFKPADTNQVFKRIYNGINGNIWFVTQQQIGYLKPTYNGVEYAYNTFLLPQLNENLVGGFEFLNQCQNNDLFLGVELGFMHLNAKDIASFKPSSPTALVTSIYALNNPDSVFHKFLKSLNQKVKVNDKSVEFSFSSTDGFYYNDLQFSTQLVGWDDDWSVWKSNTTREYSQLDYGEYTFKVKARYLGVEGEETSIKVLVEAPWYYTKTAKFIYIILGFLVILIIGIYPQKKVKEKTSKIIAQKEDDLNRQKELFLLEREKQDKELIALKNQQLEKEVNHQSKELASTTMHIVQKSEMLLTVKDKLKKIYNTTNDIKIKPEINELIKVINHDTLIDKDWDKFELYFNTVHNNFTKSVKDLYPQLTVNDLKLCAFLRMNLSSKEIASILNISTRGVEISRYRLRKKMNLDSGVNLNDYFVNL